MIENVVNSNDYCTVAKTTVVACHLAEHGCQPISPTALGIWDERDLLAVWLVGGNAREKLFQIANW